MKKILLTGVVLILLIILAADFYMDRNRANDRKNNLQASATLPDNTATAATNGNSAQDLNDDIAPASSTTTVNIKHKHRYGRHTVPVDQSLAANSSDADGLYVVTDADDAQPVAVESSKDYMGNMPKKNTFLHSTAAIRRNVHFGIEGGILQNTFYNDNASRMGTTGFLAGAMVDIRMADHLYLQPGLRFEQKGIETETITSNTMMAVDTKDNISLNYITLPVNLAVKFGDWHDVRFMVGAGPYLSYLVSAQDKYQTTTTINNTAARTTLEGANTVTAHVTQEQGTHSIPIGNNDAGAAGNMRTLDWGVNGFIGCEAPGGLFIKAGSEVGLMNIQHNASGSYSNRNLNVFVSLGYLIGSKK